MSTKRRDKRNRVLRNGEDQRPDGRYRYTYTTPDGKRHSIYSWKLEKTDSLPAGKRDCKSLREQIKDINKQLDFYGSSYTDCTVLELVTRYVKTKKGVSENTRTGYRTVLNKLANMEFGTRSIHSIKRTDAKLWLISLQENGLRYSSIHNIRGVLRPAFELAVEDDILVKNPFAFDLSDVIVNDSARREALTPMQEKLLLDFVRNDKHFSRYHDAIFILLNTGLRISEFCGLTYNDVNLKERYIHITHQLQRHSNMEYEIQTTKTVAGTRMIPISQEVCEAFKRIFKNRKSAKIEPIINGYSGFLFLDKNGKPLVALHWEKYFEHICQKYNMTNSIKMPKVTPHVCRHTYCTKMARAKMPPKELQYLMGHADIGVTMNVYTHVKYEDAKKAINDLEAVSQ